MTFDGELAYAVHAVSNIEHSVSLHSLLAQSFPEIIPEIIASDSVASAYIYELPTTLEQSDGSEHHNLLIRRYAQLQAKVSKAKEIGNFDPIDLRPLLLAQLRYQSEAVLAQLRHNRFYPLHHFLAVIGIQCSSMW